MHALRISDRLLQTFWRILAWHGLVGKEQQDPTPFVTPTIWTGTTITTISRSIKSSALLSPVRSRNQSRVCERSSVEGSSTARHSAPTSDFQNYAPAELIEAAWKGVTGPGEANTVHCIQSYLEGL